MLLTTSTPRRLDPPDETWWKMAKKMSRRARGITPAIMLDYNARSWPAKRAEIVAAIESWGSDTHKLRQSRPMSEAERATLRDYADGTHDHLRQVDHAIAAGNPQAACFALAGLFGLLSIVVFADETAYHFEPARPAIVAHEKSAKTKAERKAKDASDVLRWMKKLATDRPDVTQVKALCGLIRKAIATERGDDFKLSTKRFYNIRSGR